MYVVVGCSSTHNKLGLAPAHLSICLSSPQLKPKKKKKHTHGLSLRWHDVMQGALAPTRLCPPCATGRGVGVSSAQAAARVAWFKRLFFFFGRAAPHHPLKKKAGRALGLFRLEGVAAHGPQAGRRCHDFVKTPVRPCHFAVGANEGRPPTVTRVVDPPPLFSRLQGARATEALPSFDHPLKRVLSSGVGLLAHRLPTCMRDTVHFERRVQPPPACAACAPCRRRICED